MLETGVTEQLPLHLVFVHAADSSHQGGSAIQGFVPAQPVDTECISRAAGGGRPWGTTEVMTITFDAPGYRTGDQSPCVASSI